MCSLRGHFDGGFRDEVMGCGVLLEGATRLMNGQPERKIICECGTRLGGGGMLPLLRCVVCCSALLLCEIFGLPAWSIFLRSVVSSFDANKVSTLSVRLTCF